MRVTLGSGIHWNTRGFCLSAGSILAIAGLKKRPLIPGPHSNVRPTPIALQEGDAALATESVVKKRDRQGRGDFLFAAAGGSVTLQPKVRAAKQNETKSGARSRIWLSATATTKSSAYIRVKIMIHSSCEVEDFFETHFCKLCVILRSRVLLGLCVLIKDVGRRPPSELQCSLYQGQQGDVSRVYVNQRSVFLVVIEQKKKGSAYTLTPSNNIPHVQVT